MSSNPMKMSPPPPISSLISPLGSTLMQSSLKREKEELERKLQKALKENEILTKQLLQWKREHGELLLSQREAELGLTESNFELQNLREALSFKNMELERLRKKEVEMSSKLKEFDDLRKECVSLRQENSGLVESKGVMEVELKKLRVEIVKLEQEKQEMDKELEKVDQLASKNRKLEREREAVMDAATSRFKELTNRVDNLERIVVALSSSSGPQSAGVTNVKEQQESYSKIETLSRSHSGTPSEEKTASSMPCISKSAPASTPILYLSDDDEEVPSLKGVKRKLSLSGVSNERIIDGADSRKAGCKQLKNLSEEGDLSKENMATLKQCEKKSVVQSDEKHRVEVGRAMDVECQENMKLEMGNSHQEWEFEAEMLDALGSSTELCMKAVCALYRQHTTMGRPSASASFTKCGGFSQLYALRGTKLASFLMDGDAKGELKRSLEELVKFDPNGADLCRKIAFAHSEQLFKIYKDAEDSSFGP